MSDPKKLVERLQQDNHGLRRELEYYKRVYNEVGGHLMALEEQHSHTFRELRRIRTVVRLFREIPELGRAGTPTSTINPTLLEVLAEPTLCDRAVLLKCEPGEVPPQTFQIVSALGLSFAKSSDTLRLDDAPPFYFTRNESDRGNPIAQAFTTFLDAPHILWSFDPTTGYALLLGNSSQSAIARPYEYTDRDLIDSALDIYLSTTLRPPVPYTAGKKLPTPRTPHPSSGDEPHPGIKHAAIKRRIQAGGQVLDLIIVLRGTPPSWEFAPYFLTSWSDGYAILRTAHSRPDYHSHRTYKDLSRLLQSVRDDYAYTGSATLYMQGAAELQRIPGIALYDLCPPAPP